MHVKMKSLLFLPTFIFMATVEANLAVKARESPVGLYSEVRDLVLPGSALEPKPQAVVSLPI